MQCNACGTLLLRGASTCPRCGALTSSSSDYDALPYIEHQPYMEQAAPSTQSASSVTVEARPPDAGKSVAVYPEQKAPQSQRVSGWMTALLVLLSLLLILGGIGSVVYAVNFRPADLHAQATAVAQNFLTAQVQGTTQANSYATATADSMTPEQVYQQATSGTPVIDDPLKDDSGNVWFHYEYPTEKYQCVFRAEAYHILSTGQGGTCIGGGTFLNNLAFQAQITIIKGQYAGLTFRLTANNATSYGYYGILIGSDGSYYIHVINQQQTKTLKSGISSTIVTGQNQSNRVTIIARSNHINLYVNGQFIDYAIDTSYSSGQIALMAVGNTGPLDVAFNYVKVWKV